MTLCPCEVQSGACMLTTQYGLWWKLHNQWVIHSLFWKICKIFHRMQVRYFQSSRFAETWVSSLFLTITGKFVYVIPKVCFLVLVNMYLVVKSFSSIIQISFWSECYTNRNKICFCHSLFSVFKGFSQCLHLSLPNSKYTNSILLSSVLSKIFCPLKCSDCIDDIVCTKTDLCESSSLIVKTEGAWYTSANISQSAWG